MIRFFQVYPVEVTKNKLVCEMVIQEQHLNSKVIINKSIEQKIEMQQISNKNSCNKKSFRVLCMVAKLLH